MKPRNGRTNYKIKMLSASENLLFKNIKKSYLLIDPEQQKYQPEPLPLKIQVCNVTKVWRGNPRIYYILFKFKIQDVIGQLELS